MALLCHQSNLMDMQTFIMSLREEVEVVCDEMILKRMGYHITQILDTFYLYYDYDREQYVKEMLALKGDKDSEQTEFLVRATPYTAAMRYCKNQISKAEKSPYVGEGLNIKFEICFIPTEDNLLGIPFAEPNEYSEFLSQQPEYKYYGYWDNVDPDEDCSEEEWEQRKNDWTKSLLTGSGIPSENGFFAEIVPQKIPSRILYNRGEIYPQLLEIIEGKYPLAGRAHTHTINRIVTQIVSEMKKSGWASKDFSESYDVYRDVHKNWETKYEEEYREIYAEVIERIPATYTTEDFITKLEAPDTDD